MKRSLVFTLVLCLIAISCASYSQGLGGGSWPAFGRTAQRGQYQNTADPSPTPYVKWTITLDTAGTWSDAVWAPDGNTIYMSTNGTNALAALDPADGSLKWSVNVGGWTDATPCVDSLGNVYIGGGAAQFYSFDSSGNIRWSASVGGPSYCRSIIDEDWNVYGVADSGLVFKLSCADGSMQWSLPNMGGSWRASPALSPDQSTLYHKQNGGDDTLMAIDTATGSVVWSYQGAGGWAIGTIVDSSGNIYQGFQQLIGSSNSFMTKFDSTGTMLWSYDFGGGSGWWGSSPAISADEATIYTTTRAGSTVGGLRALNTSDGSIAWTQYTNGNIWGVGDINDFFGNPTVASDGNIFIMDANGTLGVVAPDGTLLTSFETAINETWNGGTMGPDGTLVIGGNNGVVMAFKGTPTVLTIMTDSVPDATLLQAYSATIAALSGVEPYTWSDDGNLPPGLAIDSGTGEISGTPTTFGLYTFTVTVTDSVSATDAKEFSIFAAPAPPELGGTLANGGVNFYYEDSVVVTGGWPPFTFADDGNLPPGLTLDTGTGMISGTATTAGVYDFSIMVTDSWAGGQTDLESYQIEIKVIPLDIITLSVHNGQVNETYQNTTFEYISTSTTTKTWSQPSGTIPPGLVLNQVGDDYILSGTPTTAGSYLFSIAVTDGSESWINSYKVLIDTNPGSFGNWKRVANDPSTWPYPLDPANTYYIEGTSTEFPALNWNNKPHVTQHQAGTDANGKVIVCGGWAAKYEVSGAPGLTINTNGTDPKYWDNRQSKLSIYDPDTDEWDCAYFHDWAVLAPVNGYDDIGAPTGYNNPGSDVGGTMKPAVGYGTYAGVNSCCAVDCDNDGTEEYFIFCGYPIWAEVAGIWDPDTNEWSATPAIPGFSGQHSHDTAVVKDGKIYYVTSSGTPIYEFLIYDTATQVWTDKGTLTGDYAKQYHAAEIIGNEMILTGGNNAKTVIYNIDTDTWSYDAAWDIPAGFGVRFSGSGVYDGKMYIMGGLSDTDGSDYRSMAYFDPATRTWTTMTEQLPYGMNGSPAAIVGSKLYALYGRKLENESGSYVRYVINETFALELGGAEPPVITDMERGSMTITFTGGGQTYKVQSSTDPYDFDETTMTWTDEATGLAPGTWQDTAAPTGTGAEKYYRVVGETDASVSETVGLYAVSILNGRNMMSIPFLPFPEGGGAAGTSTFDKIIGDQLTGHAVVKTLSDLIQQWNADTLTWTKIWLKVGTGWIDYDTGGAAMPFVPGRGYWVFRNGHPDTDVVLFGQVAKTDQVITVLASRNILGTPYPVDVALDDSGLVASGFNGHAVVKTLSDQILFWDAATLSWKQFWYKVGVGFQPWTTGDPMKAFEPGDGFYLLRQGSTGFTWTYPVPN